MTLGMRLLGAIVIVGGLVGYGAGSSLRAVTDSKRRRLQATGSQLQRVIVQYYDSANAYGESMEGESPQGSSERNSFNNPNAAFAAANSVIQPQLESMASNETLAEFFAQIHNTLIGGAFNGLSVTVSEAALQYLQQQPQVAQILPDTTMTLFQTATAVAPSQAANPSFKEPSAPWHLDIIDQRNDKLNGAYVYTDTGNGVDMYIVDSGINTQHTEFTGRIAQGVNAVSGDTQGPTDVEDCNGHGTHVSGLAAGTTYGAAKQSIIIPVRVYSCSSSGPVSDVLSGINWILNRMGTTGRRSVINMSFGGESNPALDDAVAKLVAMGGFVVAAAGNEAQDACGTSPAGAPDAFAVAASDKSDNFASFSNFGPCVGIIAPGVDVTSSWIGSSTATNTISGTSMASPITAGVAAEYLQANPNASPSQVRQGLVCSSTQGAISQIPTTSTANNFLFSPPGGFPPGQCATTSDAVAYGRLATTCLLAAGAALIAAL